MLESLIVKNLALIEYAEVEFKKGLNILTGETGAGKSIIIGSVNMALGGKVSKEMIRSNAEYAFAQLVFEIEDEYTLKQLENLEIYPDDNKVIISRKMTRTRSTSKINGETVTAGVLKKVAEIIIDIHGQHEHQSLLNKNKHMQILDEFAKDELGGPKEEMAQLYNKYLDLQKQLESIDVDESSRERELSFLKFEAMEIENANLVIGEDDELENKYRKMVNGQKIQEVLSDVINIMDGSEDFNTCQLVGNCVHEMSSIIGYDDSLRQLNEQLIQIEDLISDFNRELSVYISDLEFDEEDFHVTGERLDLINHLKSKYGNSIQDVLDSYNKKIKRIDELDNFSKNIEKIREEIINCEDKMKKVSSNITAIRKKYAEELVKEIKKALLDMNFLDVQFDMNFSRKDHFSATGIDEAEFLISTNPGEKLLPLGKVASGGELSRIMLAIKTVLAMKDHVYTMIFDEIDVGISGRTAQKISEKMGILAKNKQIICITHLPQIASMADEHFVIEKKTQNNETITSIHTLNEEEINYELARLLGGAKITDAVLQNAREMKKLAIEIKQN